MFEPKAESRTVDAMGLSFAGPLGIAAGIDRTGEKISALDLSGFGHIEIGTITPETHIALGERPRGLRVGINFGSSMEGLNDAVIADYCDALCNAFPHADYLCANFTAPRGGRDGNSAGVASFIARLKTERDRLVESTGLHKPLLLKVDAGEFGESLPNALEQASLQKIDGIVLVGRDLRRIAAARLRVAPLTLISVGGVETASQVVERLAAGATLVQIHSAFAADRLSGLRALGEAPIGVPES